jgi:hypothetical protein
MRWRGHSAQPTPFHNLSLREPASEVGRKGSPPNRIDI